MVTLTKVCNRCKTVHDLSMYKKDKSKKDGLYTLCINCVKKYREDNKEKIKASKKLYRSKPENKEKERLQRIKYYNDNYFSCKQKRRDYVKRRKESGNPIVNKKVDYTRYKKNKERIKTYEMYKRLFCPEYKIKKNLRIRLNKALKKNFKNCSAVQSLGLTIQEFKDYLEALFYARFILGFRSHNSIIFYRYN